MSTYFEGKFIPSDWISQAEAARIRAVSRQAIAKLVKNQRIRTLAVGGHVFVHKQDVMSFEPLPPGRPKEKKSENG